MCSRAWRASERPTDRTKYIFSNFIPILYFIILFLLEDSVRPVFMVCESYVRFTTKYHIFISPFFHFFFAVVVFGNLKIFSKEQREARADAEQTK